MKRMTLDQVDQEIARKKAELGYNGRDYVAVNSGVSRTPEKRQLLQSLNETVAAADGETPFQANF